MDELRNTTTVAENEDQELDTLVRFSQPYSFEGETYTEIDLSGLETVTAGDVIKVNNLLKSTLNPLPEMTMQFACHMAARVSHKPVEFFTRLPARDGMKVKNVVTGFIFGAD